MPLNAPRRAYFRAFLLGALLLCSAAARAQRAELDHKFDPFLRGLRSPSVSVERLRTLSKRHGVNPQTRTVNVFVEAAAGTHAADLRAADARVRVTTESNRILTADIPLDALDNVAALPGVLKIHLSRKLKPVNNVVRSTSTYNGLYLGTMDTTTASGYGVFTGTGVLIGDVDTGLDVHHPDFINGTRGTSGASSRVLFYWDQTSASVLSGGSSPTVSCSPNQLTSQNGSGVTGKCDGYGTEWSNSTINSDIRNTSCVTSNAQAPMTNFSGCIVKSSDTVGHGTAVLGCAAGNGNATNGSVPAGTYTGIAPNADLIMVESDLEDPHTCDGVSYIFGEAATRGEPAVANLSIGGHSGPHDGTSPLELCLAGLNNNGTTPGRVIVAAAGNEGEDYLHFSLSAGGSVTMSNEDGSGNLNVWGNDNTEAVGIWYDPNDAYTLTITDNNSGQSATFDANTYSGSTCFNNIAAQDATGTTQIGTSQAIVCVDNFGTTANGNDEGSTSTGVNEIFLMIDQGDTVGHTYTFTLTRTTAGGSGAIDGWLEQYYGPGYTFYSGLGGSGGDNNESVGMPGTSPYVITAGAYISKVAWTSNAPSGANPQCDGFLPPAVLAIQGPLASSPCTGDFSYLGNIAPFSSLGPARGGAAKPDLAAPGNLIVTSLSQTSPTDFVANDVSIDLFHAQTSGTSFATPFTSGSAALRLEQNPSLTTAQMKAALQSAARNDADTAVASSYFSGESGTAGNTWGAGKLLSTPAAYPAPTGLTAAASTGSVQWSWNAISNADGYRVHVSSNSTVIASLAANITTYLQNGLPPNTATSDYIEAFNAGGSTSSLTVGRYTLAVPPTSAAVTSEGASSVTLSWNAGANPSGTLYAVSQSLDDFQTNFSTPIAFSSNQTSLTATITGLTGQTSYYFRIFAENGNSIVTLPSNVVEATLGNTPASVTVTGTALGVSSISWSWTLAPNATGYDLYNGETGSFIENTAAPSFISVGLSTDAPFDLSVAGTNSQGDGLFSQTTTYTQAAPPSTLALLSISSITASLSWSVNQNPAGTPFELSDSTDGFAANFSTPIAFAAAFSGSSVTIGGLFPATTYSFRLRAENGNGVATAFAVSASTETNAAPPPATIVSGIALGVSSIEWTWTLLPSATAYNLYDGNGNPVADPIPGSTFFTETALSTNTAYVLQVAGTNAAGQGMLAGATVYTLTSVPASPAPALLSATAAGLSWSADENPAGTQYEVQASTDPDFVVALSTIGTTATSAAVVNLQPNTTYNLEVQARNGNGVGGPFTTPIATPTWAAAPSALTFTQVSSAGVAVSWSGNGNPSDTPYQLSLSTDNFVLSDSTPLPFSPEPGLSFTLSGLIPSTSYYVRVQAQNRAGILTAVSSAAYFLAPELVLGLAPGAAATLIFGQATLVVPAGAFAQGATITMQSAGVFPAPNSNTGPLIGTGAGVQISAGGLQPALSPKLTLGYTPGAPITDAQELVVAYYDPVDAVWVPLPSTVNTAADTVTAAIPHFSTYQVMQQAPASSLSSAHILVFPDPVYTSRGQQMSFTGLPAGASLTLYTFRGDKVRALDAGAGGQASWDGRNDAGNPAASGVYMVVIKSGGDTKVLKVMVER